MRIPITLVIMISLVLIQTPCHAAGPNVTIATTNGQTFEGTFLGATEKEVSLSLAGRLINLSVSDIDSISFSSSRPTAEAQPASPSGPGPFPPGPLAALKAPSGGSEPGALISEVLKALQALQALTKTELTREQYSENVQASLPKMKELTMGREAPWPDARLAMQRVADYTIRVVPH